MREDACIRMTESLCCPPEDTTTLLIRYTSIQNKKLEVWGEKKSLLQSRLQNTPPHPHPSPASPRYMSTATVNGSCNNGNLRNLPTFNSAVSNPSFRNNTSLDTERRQFSHVGDSFPVPPYPAMGWDGGVIKA